MPIVNGATLFETWQACTKVQQLAIADEMYNAAGGVHSPQAFVDVLFQRMSQEREQVLDSSDEDMSEEEADGSGDAAVSVVVTSVEQARQRFIWPANMTMRQIVAQMGDVELYIDSVVNN